MSDEYNDNSNPGSRTGTGSDGHRTKRIADTVGPIDRESQTDIGKPESDSSKTGQSIGKSAKPSKRYKLASSKTGQPDSRRGRRGRGNGTGNGNNSNSTSTGTGSGTGTGTGTKETSEQTSEIPFFVNRKTRSTKAAKKANEKMIAVSMLSIGCSALYGTVAQFAGEHWKLESNEAIELATVLNDALSTLPDTTYEKLFSIIEQYIPWIALAITAGAITIPRIRLTQQIKNTDRNGNYAASTSDNRRQATSANASSNGNSDNSPVNGTRIIEFDRIYK